MARGPGGGRVRGKGGRRGRCTGLVARWPDGQLTGGVEYYNSACCSILGFFIVEPGPCQSRAPTAFLSMPI